MAIGMFMSEQELYNKIAEARNEAAENRYKYIHDAAYSHSAVYSHTQMLAYDNVIKWFNEYLEGKEASKEPFIVEHGYMHEVEMTEEENVKWYIENCSKEDLAKMLAHRDELNKICGTKF